MLMDSLDRSYPVGEEYPSTQYNDCLTPQYSPIQYEDYSSIGTPESAGYSSTHTPLSSVSSYSSEGYSPALSHSSGFSEVPSLSSLSISSSEGSNPSLFSTSSDNQHQALQHNPFLLPVSSVRNNKNRIRRHNTSSCSASEPSSSSSSCNPRRSSAPVRPADSSSHLPSSLNTSTTGDSVGRKDSFVYDVQLESDNVLLFVPDLDLVKSHLMFAVREEVDVLKERIGELSEKISVLEYENTLLKKYAPPEALQQLQHPNP